MRHQQLHGLLPDRSRAALLILDLISDFRFPDGDQVLRAALRIAPRIAELRQRCERAGIARIYVNDNVGRWRSDSGRLIEDCLHPQSPGAEVVAQIKPHESDYVILKPRHSAFYATPLEALLDHLGVQRLIVTGVSSHQCVLFTANDAHLRGLEVVVPSDCVAAPSVRETRFALRYFAQVLGAQVKPAKQLRLSALQRRSHGPG
jgi:nicotinamidase-related amidase